VRLSISDAVIQNTIGSEQATRFGRDGVYVLLKVHAGVSSR